MRDFEVVIGIGFDFQQVSIFILGMVFPFQPYSRWGNQDSFHATRLPPAGVAERLQAASMGANDLVSITWRREILVFSSREEDGTARRLSGAGAKARFEDLAHTRQACGRDVR